MPTLASTHINTIGYIYGDRKQLGENRICLSILYECVRS